MMPSAPLKIERVFDASPDELWAAWIDPKHYAQWFNPAPGMGLDIHEFDVRPGGKIRFDMPQPDGNKNPQEGVFLSIDPPRELVTGAPDRSFVLKVNFEPEGKRTRVVVEVTGVPPEYHAMASVGWNAGFDKLARVLVGGGIPQGFTLERTFRATPAQVWEMWTTKTGLEKWFVAEGMATRVVELDLRVGGRYSLEITGGPSTLHNHGAYVAVRPTAHLAMMWLFDIFLMPNEKPYRVPITVDLFPAGTGTRMVFHQGPLATQESTDASRKGNIENFAKLAKALGE